MRTLTTVSACLLFLGAAASFAQNECGPENPVNVTPIFGGQTIDVGNAVITNDGCDLIIRGIGADGWSFKEAHAYAGVDPTPVNGGGNPAPGRFPYSMNFSGNGTSDFEFRIPLNALGLEGAGCGEQVWIALHVVVKNGNQRETGWAFGQEFSGRRWGWEVPYSVQCEDECPDGGEEGDDEVEPCECDPNSDEGCTGTN